MKKLLIIATALFLATASTKVQATGEDALQGICAVVAGDDKARFRKKVKESGIRIRDSFSGITCDGMNMLRYAMTKNAQGVGVYMVKRLPASYFDISGDLFWADENGFGETLIAKEIEAR